MSASADRFRARNFLGTQVMGAIAVVIGVYELDFARHRVETQGLVLEDSFVAGRSGSLITEVRHEIGGRSVPAVLRSWYLGFRAGDRVKLLTLPSDPTDVASAEFWQRHYGSVTALVIALIFAVREGSKLFRRPRIEENSILGDNPDHSEALRSLDPV